MEHTLRSMAFKYRMRNFKEGQGEKNLFLHPVGGYITSEALRVFTSFPNISGNIYYPQRTGTGVKSPVEDHTFVNGRTRI